MASIYLHIPFCRQMCGYCDFFKSARLDKMEQSITTMMAEIESEQGFITTTKLSTIYFGGGTPSLLSTSQVAEIMRCISKTYDVSDVSEVTLEANPDDLTDEYLKGIKEAGINRLSIGIQSFDDETLKFMNRRHNAAQAADAIHRARRAGFENIAIDLIFGVSGFGGERLTRSLHQAIELGVEHIAAYHLTIEQGTMFARRVAKGEMCAVDESVSEEEYELVRNVLTKAGYNHYEISNYALPNRESQHNSAYWSGEEYLGVGAGAHSYSHRGDWGVRRWIDGGINSGLSSYLERSGEERYQCEVLTKIERRNEIVMTSLRRSKGINTAEFGAMFGEEELKKLMLDSTKAIERGDIIVHRDNNSNDSWLKIPTERFLRSDMIIEELFLL